VPQPIAQEIHMSSAPRKRDVLGWTMAVVGLALLIRLAFYGPLFYAPISDPTGAGGGTGDALPRLSSSSFTIAGTTVDPISPGAMAPLDLELTNPHAIPLLVTDLSVTVREVNAPNASGVTPCVIGDFAVDQAASSRIKISVAPRATITLSSLGLARATWPQVGLLNTSVNQDGCKGASLMLAYTASGKLDG